MHLRSTDIHATLPTAAAWDRDPPQEVPLDCPPEREDFMVWPPPPPPSNVQDVLAPVPTVVVAQAKKPIFHHPLSPAPPVEAPDPVLPAGAPSDALEPAPGGQLASATGYLIVGGVRLRCRS